MSVSHRDVLPKPQDGWFRKGMNMELLTECKVQITYFSEMARLEKDELRRYEYLAKARRWQALSRKADFLVELYSDLKNAA